MQDIPLTGCFPLRPLSTLSNAANQPLVASQWHKTPVRLSAQPPFVPAAQPVRFGYHDAIIGPVLGGLKFLLMTWVDLSAQALIHLGFLGGGRQFKPALAFRQRLKALKSALLAGGERVRAAIINPLEDRRLFMAATRRMRPLSPGVLGHPDLVGVRPVRIPLASSRLKADPTLPAVLNGLYHPARPGQPTIIFSDGNTCSLSHIERFTPFIREGKGVLLYEYPGYGSTAGVPTEPGLFRSLDAARDFVATQGVPHHRQILYGYSLGGAVSVDSAVRHPPAALILESTMTSFPDVVRNYVGTGISRFFPLHRFTTSKLDSLRKIGSLESPLLLLQGVSDRLTPPVFAERLRAKATSSAPGNPLILLEGGHRLAPDVTRPHISRFLDMPSLKY